MYLKSTIAKMALSGSIVCLGAIVSLAEDDGASSVDRAAYTVTFAPSWNPATHPTDYPITHAKKGLLTPVIGATHADAFSLFAKGKTPSPGLERLSEMGKHDPLDQEIQSAIHSGKVGTLIRFADASPGPVHPTISSMFEVSTTFPRVSLVGMIAPSPDWFYGVSDVSLQQDGRWVSSMAVTVYAWDSGGDAGTRYMADDQDLNPKAATKALTNGDFVQNGNRVPVGTFVFKRIPR